MLDYLGIKVLRTKINDHYLKKAGNTPKTMKQN